MHSIKMPMIWRNFIAKQAGNTLINVRPNETYIIRLRQEINIAILGAIPVDQDIINSTGFQGGFWMTPVTIISQPFYGDVTINWNTIDLDYTPDPGYVGPDCFIIALNANGVQQSQYFKFLVQVGEVQQETIMV